MNYVCDGNRWFFQRYFIGIVISIAADGTQGNSYSQRSSVSADGRYVTFDSNANNLVPEDTNNVGDTFLKDVITGAIQRVNVAANGTQSHGGSFNSVITADGRYVVFGNGSGDLGVDYTNNSFDIFLKDVITGAVELVSADTPEGGYYGYISISADGHYIVFASTVSDLAAYDSARSLDVFRTISPFWTP